MKIYNTIEWQWNEETQQLEEVYSDSFEYNGPVDQLQTYGGGSGGGSGEGSGGGQGGTNTDTGQNTDDGYGELWHNENIEEYKQIISSRITELLLGQLSKIEEILGKVNIESYQKTFRDGVMNEGRNENEMMVVYQSDYDTSNNDEILNAIINWAGFIHPNHLTLTVSSFVSQNDAGDDVVTPVMQLNAPNNQPAFDIVGVYQNLSQFFNIDGLKTKIDDNKLPDFIPTDFSEIKPETFTQILDKYKDFKNQLPFFRYRTDDFFDEYAEAPLPSSYRLQKFFEEFERIKEEIPSGEFGYDAVTVKAEGVGYYQFQGDDEIAAPRLPRTLKVINKNGDEKIVYSNANGRGHRITIFSRDSFMNGDWNGMVKYDEVYDTYGGRTHFPEQNGQVYGELTADKLGDAIIDGEFVDGTLIEEDDLIVVTSYDAVRYTPKLISALESIGALKPRVVESENPVDIASDEELAPRLVAKYNFSSPNNYVWGGIAPGVFSTISAWTKPGHIIFNPFSNSLTSPSTSEILHPAMSYGTHNEELTDDRHNGDNRISRNLYEVSPTIDGATVHQRRSNANTEYQIDVTQIKPGCTYKFRVWMCSTTIDLYGGGVGDPQLESFNPFHIRAYSGMTVDHPENVVNDPTNGLGGTDSIIDTLEIPHIIYDGESQTNITLKWILKEISLTTPKNFKGGNALTWYVGYKGFGHEEPKIFANGVFQDIEIDYCGFEMFEDINVYNGYFKNGNAYTGDGGQSGTYTSVYFPDKSGRNNRLQVVANNMTWLHTPQRGFTPKWNFAPNEFMIQKPSSGFWWTETPWTNAGMASQGWLSDDFFSGRYYDDLASSDEIKNSKFIFAIQSGNNSSTNYFQTEVDNRNFPIGESDVSIQMDLYLDTDFYTTSEWEEYIGTPPYELGSSLINTTNTQWKALGRGLQTIVSQPAAFTIWMMGDTTSGQGMPMDDYPLNPGELIIAFGTEGGNTNDGTAIGNNIPHALRTHYVLPLKQWVNIAFTYNGNNLVFYVDGHKKFDITQTGATPFLNAQQAGSENWDSVPGYRTNNNDLYDLQNTKFSDIGKMNINSTWSTACLHFGQYIKNQDNNPSWGAGNHQSPTNLSIDRFYLWDTILTQEQIYRTATNPFTELGDNKQRTPYALIGSKIFNKGDGVEKVTTASPEAEVADVTKIWPNDAEYNTWEQNTSGYIISELQKLSNQDLPVYSSGQISTMVEEINTLNDKAAEQTALLQTQQTQIDTLEETLSTYGAGAANEFYGDCVSVSSEGNSYTCNDSIANPDNNANVIVECSDGTKLALYCGDPLENNDPLCDGKPTYPFGGPVTGQAACEGS